MELDKIKELYFRNPHMEDIMKLNLITYRKDRGKWRMDFTHPKISNQIIRKTTQWGLNEKRKAYQEALELYTKLKFASEYAHLFDKYIFKDALDLYIEEKGITDKSRLKFLEKKIGHIGLKQINRDTYRDIKNHLKKKGINGKPNSNGTINRCLSVLRAILNMAVEENLLDAFPKIKELPSNPREGVRLTQEMQESIIKAMIDLRYFYLIDPFKFAISTGLRKGNIINLQKRHLILGGKKIHIPGSEMKNRKPHTLDLTPGDIEIIKRNLSDSPYIFLNHKNEKLGDFKKAWTSVRAVAGLEHIVWHDLRHTCASELAESGIIGQPLQDIMAWSDPRMANRYTHLSPSYLLSLREAREGNIPQSIPHNDFHKKREMLNSSQSL